MAPTPKRYVVDEDTTDDFLDAPPLRYKPDGRTAAETAAPSVAKQSLAPVKLPPLTNH